MQLLTQAATAEAAVAAPELELEGSIFLVRSTGGRRDASVLSDVNVAKMLTGTVILSPPSLFGLDVDPPSPEKTRPSVTSDKETSFGGDDCREIDDVL